MHRYEQAILDFFGIGYTVIGLKSQQEFRVYTLLGATRWARGGFRGESVAILKNLPLFGTDLRMRINHREPHRYTAFRAAYEAARRSH